MTNLVESFNELRLAFGLFYREVIDTSDGSQSLLAWANEENLPQTNKPIIFVYPGLVSTTTSNYMKELVPFIVNKNYDVAVLVNQGLETPCLIS